MVVEPEQVAHGLIQEEHIPEDWLKEIVYPAAQEVQMVELMHEVQEVGH